MSCSPDEKAIVYLKSYLSRNLKMLIGVIGISDEAVDLIGFDGKVRPMIEATLGVALS